MRLIISYFSFLFSFCFFFLLATYDVEVHFPDIQKKRSNPTSQNIPKRRTVVLLPLQAFPRGRIPRSPGDNFFQSPMLPIQLLVLVHQQQSQREGQETREEDERGADTHSFGVSGRVTLVEDVGSEQGPALADEVQEHDPYASACVRALVVCLICEPLAFRSSYGAVALGLTEDPGKDVRYCGEDS